MSDTATPAPIVTKPAQPKPNADPTKPATVQALAPPPFMIEPMSSDVSYGKFAWYGVPGSGKTWLAGSSVDVPEMQDVLIVNAEGGTLTIESAEEIVNRDYIDKIPVVNFKQVGYVQEFLKKHCIARDANDIRTLKALQARVFGYKPEIIDEDCEDDEYTIGPNNKRIYTRVRLRRYRTIIIDSLSEVNAYLIYQLLGISLDTKFDDVAAEETAGWDEYKKGNQMLQMVLRAYRDLPMHVIFVCGAQYVKDQTSTLRWAPALIGKLGVQVQGFVDVAGYLITQKPTEEEVTTGKIPRRLYIQPIGPFDAKNRLSSFKDSFIQNPSMQKIMDAFRGVTKTMKQPPAPKPVKK